MSSTVGVLDSDRSRGRRLGGEVEHDAAPREQPGERDDERRHVRLGDDQPVQETDRRWSRRARSRSPPTRASSAPLGAGAGHDDGADGAHECHGQVDLGDEEDEDDADGDRGHARHLEQQVDEVPLRGEVLLERRKHDREHEKRDEDRKRAPVAGLDAEPPAAADLA